MQTNECFCTQTFEMHTYVSTGQWEVAVKVGVNGKQYLLVDCKFLEAIRDNGLVNQSNHSPRSPQLFQIYFCLTFPSIFRSTCALVIMETYDYET